jgi:exosortase
MSKKAQETPLVTDNYTDKNLDVTLACEAKSLLSRRSVLVSVILLLLAVTTWAYWPMVVVLFKEWRSNDDYSAGQLVPLVALFLLWYKRKQLKQAHVAAYWPALVLLLMAQAAGTFGLLFMYESAERYSLVLTIIALTLLVAGLQIFRKVFWILMFLFLMVPFPGQIHNLISSPLQRIATTGAVFMLEAFGTRVSQQGNTVTLNGQTTLAVAEACSGLRMLTAFIIVAAFIAFMVKRSRIQKAIIFFSSIPIAVVCNILRLCVTAILFTLVSSEAAEKFFHDFAGVVMMPAAVLLIFGELWIMKIVTTTEPAPKKKCIIRANSSSSNNT